MASLTHTRTLPTHHPLQLTTSALTTPLPRQPALLPAGRRPQPASRWRHIHLRPCLLQPPDAAVATAPPQPPLPAALTRSSAATGAP
ncbi:hypothetical protein, partial [Klebsiella pneumoniae]|uniref:hypothetical protein n=1 Tax=Klebsiella pneumoniae TaxID=573 RepID=UPI0025A26560